MKQGRKEEEATTTAEGRKEGNQGRRWGGKEGRKEGTEGKRENLPQGGNVRIGALHRFAAAVSAVAAVVHSSLSFCSVQSRRGYRRVQICGHFRRVVYLSVRQGCPIFIEDLRYFSVGRITISHKIVGMLCFNCCFRHEYDTTAAAASVRYRRVVGNEEEKIRRVKTRNKGRRATTEI